MGKFISLKEAINDSGIILNTKTDFVSFTDCIDLSTAISITMLTESACAEIFKSEEFKEEFIFQVMYKRVKAYGLEDKVSKSAIIASLLFNIDNPGKAITYIIELLDYYNKTNKVANGKDVMMFIYPDGFYTNDKFTEIVDKVIKPNLSTNTYIY